MADKNQASKPVDTRPCFFRYITAISRTWGLLTSIALWYIAVNLIQHKDEYIYLQWYTLALALAVTFFELVWIFTKSACCKDDGNCCCTLWRIVLWLDNWKKTVFYILISLPEFSKSSLAVLAGLLVILLGLVYLLKSFKDSDCVKGKDQNAEPTDTVCPQADLVSHEVQASTSSDVATDQKEITVQINEDKS